MLRIPPLPSVWLTGEGEASGGDGKSPFDQARGESEGVARPGTQALGNGRAGNGQSVSITSPLPKRTVDYHLPEGTSLDEAQALLARKLEEARVMIRELEKRSGLRLTLNRNFQIVVDLSGR
jgi:hypothetical protein